MSKMVTIVDYDCGNIFSVASAISHCGGDIIISSDPDVIAASDRLLLPGVGAFGSAIGALHQRGLFQAVQTFAASGKPFIGICVGMQAMLDYSEEFGRHDGLALIPGRIAAIPKTTIDNEPHVIPHIGWAALSPGVSGWHGSLLDKMGMGDRVYFVHSFSAIPVNHNDILATCTYNGHVIVAAIARDNMVGVQFHPEKSGTAGLAILQEFLMR